MAQELSTRKLYSIPFARARIVAAKQNSELLTVSLWMLSSDHAMLDKTKVWSKRMWGNRGPSEMGDGQSSGPEGFNC